MQQIAGKIRLNLMMVAGRRLKVKVQRSVGRTEELVGELALTADRTANSGETTRARALLLCRTDWVRFSSPANISNSRDCQSDLTGSSTT